MAIFDDKVILIETTFVMSVLAKSHEKIFFKIEDQNVFIEPVI